MRRNTLRLLCLALSLTLLLALAACGRSPAPEASGGEESAAPSRENTASDAASAEPDPTQSRAGTEQGEAGVYNGLFDDSRVHSVDVTISDADWADLKANPLDKTKYKATVVIDGETLEEVSFAAKGNTSLSAVASDPDSDRYSFKLNFGKYNKGQSYHGLNKLNLNNLYADASYLKDDLSYWLFRQTGVDAPLTSFVWLRVNGADHGLYIAIEDVSESWLARTRDGEGVLYKPESERLDQAKAQPDREGGFPGGNGEQPDFPGGNGGFPGGEEGFPGQSGQQPAPPEGSGQQPTPPEGNGQQPAPPEGNGQQPMPPEGNGEQPAPPEGNGEQPGFPGGQGGFPGQNGEQGGFPGGRGFGEAAKGADLRYVDDDPASYSDIFDNTETDADQGAQSRVIAALKALSEGRAEEALDCGEVIRYFAAHNFTLNYDSYTGNMLHNYYLYERDGKLSMLPWDYNLAFGGFGGGMGGGMGGRDALGGGEAPFQPGSSSFAPGETGENGGSAAQEPPAAMESGMQGKMGQTDATLLINTGIDTPLSGTQAESRPMWAWIAADPEALAQYHEALEALLERCFDSGALQARLEALHSLLRPYVERDPTAFYSVEQFDTAVETLERFCLLRAQSIRAQLEGSLAARTEAQDAAARIDASGLDLSVMGTHTGGGPEGADRREGRNRP